MLAKLIWIYWWKQNTKITRSIIIIWGWVRKYFSSLCEVTNLNTTAETKSSIPQSPWHGGTLRLKEKLRFLTKVKFSITLFAMPWEACFEEREIGGKLGVKHSCAVFCANCYLIRYAGTSISLILLFFLLIIAWHGILCCRHMAEWLRWRHLFNILTGEIILGLYNYVKEINSKYRKCGINFKKGKSLF